jgi:hypothetical protein
MENGIYKAAGARLKGITQSAKPLISNSFLTWEIINNVINVNNSLIFNS